jgi:four helix bundle protein
MKGGGKFEDLQVWKRSARLCADVYKHFMHSKDFGFKNQITRSALSVPSNIAESYERESVKEIANFINYAKGSAGELRTQIYIGIDIGYIEKQVGQTWILEVTEISKMLSGFIKSVRKRV